MDIRLGNEAIASAGAPAKVRPRTRRGWARGERGQAMVEFALVFVVLLPLLTGIIVFGIAFNNYLALTSATAIGAQQVSASRGVTTDPCSLVDQAVIAQTPFNVPQNQGGLQFAMQINPPSGGAVPNPTTSGGSNASYTGSGTSFSCSSPNNATGPPANLMPNGTLTVTVTYPCSLIVYGTDFAPNCRLTAVTQEAIQ